MPIAPRPMRETDFGEDIGFKSMICEWKNEKGVERNWYPNNRNLGQIKKKKKKEKGRILMDIERNI